MSEDESDPYNLDSEPDPAAFAATVLESSIDEADGSGENADTPVYVVGVGPGNLEYLTPRGQQAIRETDMVVGFETVVDFAADETDTDLLTCGYASEADTLAEFGRRVTAGDRGMAVFMGDPNHSSYQFLGKIQRIAERPVRVIPGISSLQIATSRAWTPMEDTRFVTLHKSRSLGADLGRLAGAAGGRHLLVLPRPFDWIPDDIAEFLLDSDADASPDALVLERLIHDGERITRTTLGGLHDSAGGSGPDPTPYSDLSALATGTPTDVTDWAASFPRPTRG